MKITAVSPVVAGAGMRNWIFTKVETDAGSREDGIPDQGIAGMRCKRGR
jgi:hypothetical protein